MVALLMSRTYYWRQNPGGQTMSLNGKGAVTGIGETAYVRASPKSAFELQIEASLLAIADAGLDPKDIDGIIPIGITGAPAEAFVTNFGIPDLRFSTVVPMAARAGWVPCNVPSPQSRPVSAITC